MIDYGKKGYKIAIFAMVLAILAFSINGNIDLKVNKSGDNMTGILNMTNNNITDVNTLSINNGITFLSRSETFNYSILNNISNSTRPTVLSLNVSMATGANNNTHIFTNGHSLPDFSDFNITQNNIPLNFCFEENSSKRMHINVTGNGTVKISYGNPSNTSQQNCTATNIKYYGYTNTEFLDSVQPRINNIEYESIIQVNNINSNVWWGLAKTMADIPIDGLVMKQYSNIAYSLSYNNSNALLNSTSSYLTTGNSYRFTIRRYDNQADYFINDTKFMESHKNILPDEPLGLGMNFYDANGATQQWAYVSPFYPNIYWNAWGIEEAIPTYSSGTLLYCFFLDTNGVVRTAPGAC